MALAAIFTLLALTRVSNNGAEAIPGEGIIRVGGQTTLGDNGRGFQAYFVDRNCREFLFSGWNNWQMIELAAGRGSAIDPDKFGSVKAGKNVVRYIYDSAQDSGLTVGRFFAHGVNKNNFVLQPKLGEYNEKGFEALDWVLAEAGSRGLKLILAFADNWKVPDGRQFYAEAAGMEPMDFYSDPKIKEAYKNHIKTMVNRENSLTGVKYKNDPTIFAWDLMNEPRCDCDIAEGGPFCELSCAGIVQSWIEEISLFLKQQDPNHMVVVGEEGFYSLTPWKRWVNPDAFFSGGAPWAQRAGQDFIQNHNLATIDYLSIHSWPDNFGLPELWFQEVWVREHNNDAWWLERKPFVVEEFGKIVVDDDDSQRITVRDPFIKAMFKQFTEIRAGRGPLKGIAFWEFDAANHTKPGVYGIKPTHSTWRDIIAPQSTKIKDMVGEAPIVPHCAPGKSRSFDAKFLKDGNRFYITPGANLIANWDGDDVGKPLKGVTLDKCIAECEKQKSCSLFNWNEDEDDGTCVLKDRGAVAKFKWNVGGWQTFYKKQGSTNCKTENCALCEGKNDGGTCLKCKEGMDIYLTKSDKVQCKAKAQ